LAPPNSDGSSSDIALKVESSSDILDGHSVMLGQVSGLIDRLLRASNHDGNLKLI